MSVNMLFVIGGDGTHRAIEIISNELKLRKFNVCVAGIPKTIGSKDFALILIII